MKEVPQDESYESFIKMLKEMLFPIHKRFVVKECRMEGYGHKLDELFDMFIDAGDRIATYLWRAGTDWPQRWMDEYTCRFLPLALRGAMAGNMIGGNVGLHHWHVISVNGKGDAATEAGERPPRVDVWNEIAWPPEYPLSTYEMSHMMPHLADSMMSGEQNGKQKDLLKFLRNWQFGFLVCITLYGSIRMVSDGSKH